MLTPSLYPSLTSLVYFADISSSLLSLLYIIGCVGLGLAIASMSMSSGLAPGVEVDVWGTATPSLAGGGGSLAGGGGAHPLDGGSSLESNSSSALRKNNPDVGGGAGGAGGGGGENNLAIDERGQQLIAEALMALDTYPLSPFGDAHPWVLELGILSFSPFLLPFLSLLSSCLLFVFLTTHPFTLPNHIHIHPHYLFSISRWIRFPSTTTTTPL